MSSEKSISPELRDWLDRRSAAIRTKAEMMGAGWSMLLKDTVVDPLSLPEPLRTEATEYLRQADRSG